MDGAHAGAPCGHGVAAAEGCPANLVQGTVRKILVKKSNRIRCYHLERRDANFEQTMAKVLCVCLTRSETSFLQRRNDGFYVPQLFGIASAGAEPKR
jgi:hypothetical protein